MIKQYILLIVSIWGICLVSCQNTKEVTTPNKELAKILDQYVTESDAFDPMGATSKGNRKYDALFENDLTADFQNRYNAFVDRYLSKLNAFKLEDLSENDQISVQILKNELEMSVKQREFKYEQMPIHQFWGTHLTFFQYGSGQSDQPFKTVKNYEDFLKRMDGYVAWSDTAIVRMRDGIAKNMVLPKSLVAKLQPQFAEQVVNNAQASLFYGPIKNMPKDFTAAQKNTISTAYKNAILTKLVPSFERMATFIKTEYEPKARLTSGYGSLPNGDAQYRYWVKQWTTTNLKPNEIHELGLKEVARIRAEMEKIKDKVGFKGSLNDFFNFTTTNTQFKPYKTPKEVLDGFHKIHQTMEPQLKKLFNNEPKSKFEIRQTEKYRELTASAEYSQGTADFSRPGIFYTPIIDAKNFVYPGMESLFLHEAIPGHHYQCSLQIENNNLPEFRKYYWNGAYGEGWALYCESLGKELGLYTDPFHEFGALGDEMHRAIRLVVDTGLHAKNWSREKAIQYSLENEPTTLQAATAEIERYMAIPGQALSYKIGQLKIRELRTKYEKKPGFDIAKFHNKILANGNLPLSLLEKIMDKYFL